MPGRRTLAAFLSLLGSLAGATALSAQRPLAPVSTSGQVVYPVFEGWYQNSDGTYSLSFGYFNRNSEQLLDIPIGPNNFIAPGPQNQGQPTHFETRRHWGVFAVKVPADFARNTVTWTLKVGGETIEIPGSLRPEWQIDALDGEAGSGNTPPVLRFGNGPEGSGPGGVMSGPMSASVGKPMTISVWAKDDGRTPAAALTPARSAAMRTTLTWTVHQGPAGVIFGTPTSQVPIAGAQASTTVTFSEPGEYILRVQANDASGVAGAGHAQCCWSNGFIKVDVSK